MTNNQWHSAEENYKILKWVIAMEALSPIRITSHQREAIRVGDLRRVFQDTHFNTPPFMLRGVPQKEADNNAENLRLICEGEAIPPSKNSKSFS